MKREKRKREEKIGNTPPKRLSFNSLRSVDTDSMGECQSAKQPSCLVFNNHDVMFNSYDVMLHHLPAYFSESKINDRLRL